MRSRTLRSQESQPVRILQNMGTRWYTYNQVYRIYIQVDAYLFFEFGSMSYFQGYELLGPGPIHANKQILNITKKLGAL